MVNILTKLEGKLIKTMRIKSSNPSYHIAYWIFVIVVLTMIFGLSWGNKMAAFYFISMLLPVVLGTSYFFNYVLVLRFFLKRKFVRFILYSLYTVIISLYLEMIVLMFSFIYLGNFSFQKFNPNASDSILLAVVLYLLVFIGSALLMAKQIQENKSTIKKLINEREKMKKTVLEIVSNRKQTKIPYDDIVYVESLADYIKIHTVNEQIVSKEKISKLAEKLPGYFIRIHRSFIINKDKLKQYSYNEVLINDISLNIGRSYRQAVKE